MGRPLSLSVLSVCVCRLLVRAYLFISLFFPAGNRDRIVPAFPCCYHTTCGAHGGVIPWDLFASFDSTSIFVARVGGQLACLCTYYASGHNLVTSLKETPKFGWCLVRRGSKNGHHKNISSKHIKLYVENLLTILGLIVTYLRNLGVQNTSIWILLSAQHLTQA